MSAFKKDLERRKKIVEDQIASKAMTAEAGADALKILDGALKMIEADPPVSTRRGSTVENAEAYAKLANRTPAEIEEVKAICADMNKHIARLDVLFGSVSVKVTADKYKDVPNPTGTPDPQWFVKVIADKETEKAWKKLEEAKKLTKESEKMTEEAGKLEKANKAEEAKKLTEEAKKKTEEAKKLTDEVKQREVTPPATATTPPATATTPPATATTPPATPAKGKQPQPAAKK